MRYCTGLRGVDDHLCTTAGRLRDTHPLFRGRLHFQQDEQWAVPSGFRLYERRQRRRTTAVVQRKNKKKLSIWSLLQTPSSNSFKQHLYLLRDEGLGWQTYLTTPPMVPCGEAGSFALLAKLLCGGLLQGLYFHDELREKGGRRGKDWKRKRVARQSIWGRYRFPDWHVVLPCPNVQCITSKLKKARGGGGRFLA